MICLELFSLILYGRLSLKSQFPFSKRVFMRFISSVIINSKGSTLQLGTLLAQGTMSNHSNFLSWSPALFSLTHDIQWVLLLDQIHFHSGPQLEYHFTSLLPLAWIVAILKGMPIFLNLSKSCPSSSAQATTVPNFFYSRGPPSLPLYHFSTIYNLTFAN